MIHTKETIYQPYGSCISISNDTIELIVTVEKGPRIVYLGFVGEDNILYNDTALKYKFLNKEISQICGQTAYHYLYGGHRFYLSPSHLEQARYPDNDAVIYSVDDDGITFQSLTQINSNMQLSCKIMLKETGTDFMIVHTVANRSSEIKHAALCTTTMVNQKGYVILPQNAGNDIFIANRVYVCWPFTRLHDSRLSMNDSFMTIQQNPSINYPFKIGYNNTQGQISYVTGDTVLSKHYVHDPQAVYPDNGASSQIYCCKDFLELTVQSPMYRISPDETIKHVENFSLHHTQTPKKPKNDEEYQSFLESLA